MHSWIHSFIQARKIGVLGAGNLSLAILEGLIKSSTVDVKHVFVNNRNSEKLKKINEVLPGVNIATSSESLLENCSIIILGVKPQDLVKAIEPVRHQFTEEHIVISLAAGVSLKSLEKLIPKTKQIIRWMPNTPIKVQEAVIGYSLLNESDTLLQLCDKLLSSLGVSIQVDDGDEMNALTIACASGPGFVFEFLSVWQSWLESYGFSSHIAKSLSLQTFFGTMKLANENQSLNFHDLQNQVMSKKGVTFAGINSLRNFEFEDMLNTSFEKAFQRALELEREFEKEQLDKK